MCQINIYFRDLKFLQERQKRKCEKLEQNCREKESLYFAQIQNLQEQNKVSRVILFQKLSIILQLFIKPHFYLHNSLYC